MHRSCNHFKSGYDCNQNYLFCLSLFSPLFHSLGQNLQWKHNGGSSFPKLYLIYRIYDKQNRKKIAVFRMYLQVMHFTNGVEVRSDRKQDSSFSIRIFPCLVVSQVSKDRQFWTFLPSERNLCVCVCGVSKFDLCVLWYACAFKLTGHIYLFFCSFEAGFILFNIGGYDGWVV